MKHKKIKIQDNAIILDHDPDEIFSFCVGCVDEDCEDAGGYHYVIGREAEPCSRCGKELWAPEKFLLSIGGIPLSAHNFVTYGMLQGLK